MRYIYLIWIVVVTGAMSCSRQKEYQQNILQVERFVREYPDSALNLLGGIEPSDIDSDSLKALYYLVRASAHAFDDGSMYGDSMISFSREYYRHKDRNRYLQSTDMYALHLYWTGKDREALQLLDSVIASDSVPDAILVDLLQSRVNIGGAVLDAGTDIERCLRRLMELDSMRTRYKFELAENYMYALQPDSALALIDEVIDETANSPEKINYIYEKIGMLHEAGRYAESLELTDYVMANVHDETAMPYLYFWKALTHFNQGNLALAESELAEADSLALLNSAEDAEYYESFAGRLRDVLSYRQKGILPLIQLARQNNITRNRLYRLETAKSEAQQESLIQQNKALELRAESQRKTIQFLISLVTAIVVAFAAFLIVRKRKQGLRDVEERAETLQRMVDELSNSTSVNESLRRAMLQQLGIIKMVAGTPTEENRELLRKVSSIGTDTKGDLVDWTSVYAMIDNLYDRFYTRLHHKYGALLSPKEEQTIILMIADFSTKEISVITGQATGSVYVRKSAIRKKLGVGKKEDILAFLRDDLKQ